MMIPVSDEYCGRLTGSFDETDFLLDIKLCGNPLQGSLKNSRIIRLIPKNSYKNRFQDFHADIYLSETWDDFRLKHSSDEPVLVKDIDLYEELWHPDLYFSNAKEAKYHTVTAPNFLLWIYPNGTIYLDTR